MRLSKILAGAYLLISFSTAQNDNYEYDGDYNDYAGDYGQQDNLYHDYAERQNTKVGGGEGGNGPMKLLVVGGISWVLGAKFHSKRTAKKLKVKHQKEQKQLYAQYYNDVYKLSEHNQALANQAEELKDLVRSTEAKAELEALQRDYDEFKQPDIDGDDRISRAEFNMYVKNYLSSYPGLSEKDYPKFEEFDHDADGFVSFSEYSQQMALIAAQAEKDNLAGGDKQKAKAMNDLYNSAKQGGGGVNDYYR